MGEEANTGDYDDLGDEDGGGRNVVEWVEDLPSGEDLVPLSHFLIPRELASAFGITLEPPRTALDVHRASKSTVASLRRQSPHSSSSSSFKSLRSSGEPAAVADGPMVVEGDDSSGKGGSGELSRNLGRANVAEEADSAMLAENANEGSSARALKRQRLVWRPELHRRFVDVVAHLGSKNAVPKTIVQLMNVEGLTRENVASHLQKYRLYLKRMQGSSDEPSSSTDRRFASTPAPHNPQEAPAPLPPYAPFPSFVPMPMAGWAHYGHGAPAAMVPLNEQHGGGPYHHPFAMFGGQPRDWPGGNIFASMIPHRHVPPE